MPKDLKPINYTSKDFTAIKKDLVEYVKRYYPDNFRDFNEGSFGSIMLDLVSYVGDQLSFFVDYGVNESFLDTAIEQNNIIKLAKYLGYKFQNSPSSYGICDFYILVPTNTSDPGPNLDYAPVLKRGSMVRSREGTTFILNEDVDFSKTDNEIIVARVNESTGAPTFYAVKASGQVVSGQFNQETFDIDTFEKFKKLELSATNVAEIISVTDSEGHEYHEVEYLSQNIVYRALINRNSDRDNVTNILKAIPVPRRFVVENIRNKTTIQFGYGSEEQLTDASVADPANLALSRFARDYVTDTFFDPTKLTETDKFGVAPSNTTIRVVYRTNNVDNVNAASNSIVTVVRPIISFRDPTSLSATSLRTVQNSLEVSNPEPITGDLTLPSSEELKIRALNTFASQGRAVTKQDYVSAIYNMPQKFGAIKRANIVRDPNSFRRNLNLYVVSEDREGKLIQTNTTIKQNLKTWLNSVRMVNDTIDILDARIVNVGFDYKIILKGGANRTRALQKAQAKLVDKFSIHKEIGEPFFVTDVFQALKEVEEVLDVTDVNVVNKVGGLYSDINVDIEARTSADGRLVLIPEDTIIEIKYPELDIRGEIV